MDNFMDQLSQKLNAQQIIRANGEAESEAMGVMRAQVREYQDCLDRMKSVADELGGLQQTIAALPDLSSGAGVDGSVLEGLKAQMESMNKANEDYLQQMQSDLLAGQNDFIAKQQDLAMSQNELMSRQSEMLESRSNELKEQIEAIKVSNEEHLERIRNDIADSGNDELKGRLDLLEEQIGNQLGDLQQGVSAQIAQVRAANEEFLSKMQSELSQGASNSGEDVIEVVRQQIDETLQNLTIQINSVKQQMDKIQNTNDQYLQQMQKNLRQGQEKMLESSNGLAKTLENADVHKECVRVYRNVQASIQDENAKQLASIREDNASQLDSIKSETGRCIAAVRDESSKLLGSLKNDNGRQIDGIREENAKLLVSVKTETSKIEEEVGGVKKLAVIAIIISLLSVVAPFAAQFLLG